MDESNSHIQDMATNALKTLVVRLPVNPRKLRQIPSPIGFKFHSLPPELRNWIYSLVMANPKVWRVARKSYNIPPPFINTCRLFRNEALGLFYSTQDMKFVICSSTGRPIRDPQYRALVKKWSSTITEESACNVRRLLFEVGGYSKHALRNSCVPLELLIRIEGDLREGTAKSTFHVLGDEVGLSDIGQDEKDLLTSMLKSVDERYKGRKLEILAKGTARLYLQQLAGCLQEIFKLQKKEQD